MKKMLALSLLGMFLTAQAATASEKCTISLHRYDATEDSLWDAANERVVLASSWKDCYTRAVNLASKYAFIEPATRKGLQPTASYAPQEDIHHSGDALIREGKLESVNVQVNVRNIYEWSFNDGILFKTHGMVSKFNDPSNPDTGNIAVDQDQSLIKP